ncbi:putative pyridoxal phosphate-dependent aminotransferase EpsN [compost metagenome]
MPEASFGRATRWLTTMTMDPELLNANRTDLVNYLNQYNIESRPVWKPLHLQPLFKNIDYYTHDIDMDISRRLFFNGICLPSDTKMSVETQGFVIEKVKDFLKL